METLNFFINLPSNFGSKHNNTLAKGVEISVKESSENEFDELLMQLHNQIVSESISDVYSGHSRCEKLSNVDCVTYFNDSLAQTIESAIDGLNFIVGKKIIWIMNESDDIEGLHQFGKVIAEKIIGIICVGDHNSQTMLKLMDYAPIVLSATNTTEAAEMSLFFNPLPDTVIFCPGSPICPKQERHQDQGHLFKKAVKTIELNKAL
jgi:UDP-N-acetylmuramoylalanine--D-glutamate ligase